MLTIKTTLDKRVVINLDMVKWISTATKGTGTVTVFTFEDKTSLDTEEPLVSVLSRVSAGYSTSDRHDYP